MLHEPVDQHSTCKWKHQRMRCWVEIKICLPGCHGGPWRHREALTSSASCPGGSLSFTKGTSRSFCLSSFCLLIFILSLSIYFSNFQRHIVFFLSIHYIKNYILNGFLFDYFLHFKGFPSAECLSSWDGNSVMGFWMGWSFWVCRAHGREVLLRKMYIIWSLFLKLERKCIEPYDIFQNPV